MSESRNELVAEIKALANKARSGGHMEAASVLFSLAGSIQAREEGLLMMHVAIFTIEAIKRYEKPGSVQ